MPINLISEIVPKGTSGFALLDDAYIRGAFHVVDNLTTRNLIPTDRRKWGMRVFVQSTDTVYKLNQDLSGWTVDNVLTVSLQEAYNQGATIQTTPGVPVSLSGSDYLSRVFEIKTLDDKDILTASADNTVEFFNQLKGKEYTSSINSTIISNSNGIILDRTSKVKYRAIQYFYTVSNSDGSGFETGQLFIVHNGAVAPMCANMGNAIGTSCGIVFDSQISSTDIILLANTDNSGAFSRIVHMFKIALT